MGAKKAAEAMANAKSSKYISLEEDGDRAIFTIPWYGEEDADDPYVHEQVWNDKTQRFETFTAAHKADGKDPNCRFFFSVYGKEKGELQLFQCTMGTYKDILLIKDKHGDLSRIFIEVRRHGAKGSKKTKYKAMYDGAVPDELHAKISKMERFNLPKEATGGERSSDSSSSSGSSSKPGTISAEVADGLLSRLRVLTEEKKNMFLSEFKGRVRELPADRLDAAKKLIDKLEGKTVENDEFS